MSVGMAKAAIAAAAWPNRIGVYTQRYALSNVLDALVLDGNVDNIGSDKGQSNAWHSVELPLQCDLQTSVCCISWGDSNLSLFYQNAQRQIVEMRYDGQRWSPSSFVQNDTMVGTAIAAVQSAGGERVMLFFQDYRGDVCSRRATNWEWEGEGRILQAATATPLAATTWSDTRDIRLYFQDSDTKNVLEFRGSFDGDDWSLGTLQIPSSKLLGGIAAVSRPGPEIWVYVQDTDNSLMEFRCGPDFVFTRGTLRTEIACPNTDIAALPRNLSNDFCINLFWATPEQILQQRIWQPGTGWLQASPVADGLIPVAPQKSGSIVEGDHDLNQLSISNAYNSPPNPRQIAIAAGGWSDDITVNIRVYTQSGGSIREVCLDKGQDSAGSLPDFYHGWYNGSFQGTCAPWSALCCITLDASNMELFYQTEDNVIHTSYYDGKNWSSATLSLTDAMPGTDMAVVYNHDRSNAMFFLQDKDSFLCSLRYTNSTWEPVVRVFSAATATPIAATYLSESDAIFLYFKDNTGQVQEYRGRFDGEWVLQDLNGQPSQTLGSVAAVSWHNNFEGWGGLDEFRLYMQGQDGSLIESNGNNPGTLGTVAALPNVNISAFVLGWIGRFLVLLYWVDPDKILQQRVWKDKWLSTNPIGAPLLTLDPLVVEAKWISECITEIGGNNNALSAAVRAMSNELTTSSPLHDAAEAAVAGISELALSIEALSKPYGSSRDALMAKCKGQSLTVAQRFNDLHTEAHAILGQATNLATQITYQQTIIQSNLTRVAEMQTLTAKKQTAIQQEMKTQTDAIQTENDAIATARQALLNAEQKKEQDEEDDADTSCLTTVLTAIVPFLGFAATAAASQGFDEAIKAANAAIEAAATNMASDQKALENSQKNYAAIAEQVASLTQLQETLSGFGPVLQSQSDTVTTMQTRTGTLENNALNVGVFVGKLAGKASALQFQDTATLLAQTVLAIQKLLETKNQLTGILVDDPESLDPVLQAIAKSPLEHTAVDEMILGP